MHGTPFGLCPLRNWHATANNYPRPILIENNRLRLRASRILQAVQGIVAPTSTPDSTEQPVRSRAVPTFAGGEGR